MAQRSSSAEMNSGTRPSAVPGPGNGAIATGGAAGGAVGGGGGGAARGAVATAAPTTPAGRVTRTGAKGCVPREVETWLPPPATPWWGSSKSTNGPLAAPFMSDWSRGEKAKVEDANKSLSVLGEMLGGGSKSEKFEVTPSDGPMNEGCESVSGGGSTGGGGGTVAMRWRCVRARLEALAVPGEGSYLTTLRDERLPRPRSAGDAPAPPADSSPSPRPPGSVAAKDGLPFSRSGALRSPRPAASVEPWPKPEGASPRPRSRAARFSAAKYLDRAS
mmetsp:Transcript_30058/g.87535  ORF Transcript_30058/g.87535 Transcript_30058/m.87535 type:complete len:275 (-) Transcript_30058:959-1783(-)